METHYNFVLFYSSADEFSNWYMRNFEVNGITFNCMEQYMMYAKAKLFGDKEAAREILEAKHPREQKRLGRQVKNYDDTTWAAKRLSIVAAGCYQKFRQHADLKGLLLGTLDATIVEASPTDDIWGVALSMSDPDITNPKKWKGQNLLGQALMMARDRLGRKTGVKS